MRCFELEKPHLRSRSKGYTVCAQLFNQLGKNPRHAQVVGLQAVGIVSSLREIPLHDSPHTLELPVRLEPETLLLRHDSVLKNIELALVPHISSHNTTRATNPTRASRTSRSASSLLRRIRATSQSDQNQRGAPYLMVLTGKCLWTMIQRT